MITRACRICTDNLICRQATPTNFIICIKTRFQQGAARKLSHVVYILFSERTRGIFHERKGLNMNETWLLTVKELMQHLHVGRDKAYALMHSSGFPAIRIGSQYFVDKDALRTWVDKQAYKTFEL